MAIIGTILLVILKIILIILCVVAAILCVVLFVPVRYRLEGSKDGDHLKGSAEVTFLVRAFIFRFRMEKSGGAEMEKSTHFYIFGVDPKERKQKRREKKKEEHRRKKKAYLDHLKKEDPEKYEELKKEARQRKESRENQKTDEKEKTETGRKSAAEAHSRKEGENGAQQNTGAAQTENGDKKRKHDWTVIPYKMIEAVGRVFSKICHLSNRLSYWFSFLTSPLFLNALHHVSSSVIRLIRALLPKKLSGKVEMGFDDPSVTGKVLAIFCGWLHAYGPDFYVIPDFEQKKLEGNAACEGQIRLILPARLIVSLLLDRNVREAYHVFKNRKEEA